MSPSGSGGGAGVNAKNVEAIYPLSPQQQGMLFETVSTPESGLHIEQNVRVFEGAVDETAFRRAWEGLLERHSILRTGFVWKEQEQPLQVVFRQVELCIERQDWRGLSAEQQRSELDRYLDLDRRRGFALARPPLMRLALFRLEEERTRIVRTFHHILLDGWCQPILHREFLTLYFAFRRGEAAHLEPARPYREYIAWLKQQELSRAELFWRAALRGFRSPTRLGVEEAAEPVGDAKPSFGEAGAHLSPALAAALSERARRQHVTLNSLVQGMWAVLLSRCAGTHDVVFGTTVSGRPPDLPGAESMLGLFVNTLPFRVEIAPEAAFWPWLEGVQRRHFELRQYEHCSAGQVHQWSELAASSPLFESLLVFENYPAETAGSLASPLKREMLRPAGGLGAQTRYPLAALVAAGEGLEIRFVYDQRRFGGSEIERLLAQYAGLLEHLAGGSEPSVGDLMARIPGGAIPRVRVLRTGSAPEPERAGVAPRSATEAELARLWGEALGTVPASIHDNFLAMGGHSLVAAQLLARVRSVFRVSLALGSLFEAPTIAGLAARIEAARGETGMAPPLLRRQPCEAPLPLSPPQQRLWFIDQMEPGRSFYNVSAPLRLTGPLHRAALEASLNEIVRRHEALRTTFPALGGQPCQRIAPQLTLSLPLIDLQGLDAPEREALARRLVREEAELPFDLAAGPLLRGALLRLRAEQHLLLLTLHHMVSDGWSQRLLGRELAALYAAFASGLPSPLPELPVQYADYALWQQEWLRGGRLEEQLSYWKRQLAGAPPLLELPADHPRPAAQRFRGARHAFRLPPSLAAALRQLSREAGATLFMTLLAAFQTLLARQTGQTDIVVGSPIAGRNQAEIEGLIGFFVNTLVLRSDLSGDPPFRDLLGRVRETTIGAYTHQELPFERLVEELQPRRDLSYPPLVQVLFSLQPAPGVPDRLGDLAVSPVEVERETAIFDLTLFLTESGPGLSGVFEYNTDLFEPGTIARLTRQFETLLAGIVAAPEQRLSRLPLLAGPERRQLLTGWNATRMDFPAERCLHEFVEEQAARTPEAAAVVCGAGSLTYGELDARASRLARALQSLGVGPEVRVGVCLERSPELVVALLAILKAGGAYVPLDPAYPPERLAFLLEDARAPVLVTQEGLRSRLPVTPARVLCLDARVEAMPLPVLPPHQRRATAQNLAYLIYTSGSTGRPKGVAIEHRSAAAFLAWAHSVFPPAELRGVLAATSICFDLSVFELFVPLSAGGTVLLADNLLALPDLPARGQVTLINTVPSAMAELLRLGPLPPSVRTVNLAGEPLSTALVKQLYGLGTVAQVHDLYGPSEATTYSTFARREASGPATIGRPIANTQVYVLDEQGEPAPVGVAGELVIGGAGLARGYLDRPALTAEKFLPDPFSGEPGARLYRTGDRARWLPDGNLEFLGRRDGQVKLRGFRIELGEVEAVLAQHPDVEECVVLARGATGDEALLCAYLVPAKEPAPSAAGLRQFLQARLPEYMLPNRFMTLPALPLTPNGKVDRKALPAPQPADREEGRAATPRTPVEAMLAEIWAELLGLERVGVEESFFDLGGHSLLAARLVSRIRAALQVELPLRALFEAPTVAALAARIDENRAGTARSLSARTRPPLRAVSRAEALPLSGAQQRLWFIDQLDPGSSALNMPAAFRLSGPLDVAALEQSLSALVARHEALRATFMATEQGPRHWIAAAAPVAVPVDDLRALPPDHREAEAQRLSEEDARRPFDLREGPLLRARLLRLEEQAYLFLLTLHHIAADGWSFSVLFRELGALYEAFAAGRPPRLSPLPIQYPDFAVWQQQWREGEEREKALAYWRARLAGAPACLELPSDYPRPAVQSYRGESHRQTLSPSLARALRELSRSERATLFMTLLAGFQLLLFRATGQQDMVVGTDVAGRNQPELEALIGCFVNHLVLRTNLSGDPSFRELLGRVREGALGAYAHQELPFDHLVEALQPERSLGHTPLFQVLFVLQNAPSQPLELVGLSVQPRRVDAGSAKFDLSLFVSETGEGLTGVWVYRSDLYAAARIRRLAGQWERLLEAAAARPDARLSELLKPLADTEREEKMTERIQRGELNLHRFRGIKPKPVSFSQEQLVTTEELQPGQRLPLRLRPAVAHMDLAEWAGSQREFLLEQLRDRGALLFRGFDTHSLAAFEKAALALCPELFGDYGDLPRAGASEKIYKSTPYPPDQPILFHNESSHLHCWPMFIWFYCVQAAEQGGETPLVDCHAIYQQLDPALRARFQERELMYVRNYGQELDVSWQQFFRTEERAVVEAACREAGMAWEWKPDGGLRTRQVRPAIVPHPRTGLPLFFNQIMLHHVACLEPAVRASLEAVFAPEDLPRQVFYGDGSAIEESVMAEVRELYDRNAVSFPWEPGDLLMVDNMRVAHGRSPYAGPRQIVVAMGEMTA